MKRALILSAVFLLFSCAAQKTLFYGTDNLQTFREGRDLEFRNKEESPLTKEDFPLFKGLDYFQTDNAFRVSAKFTRTPNEDFFQMPTSSGKEKKFVKYGVLNFKLGEIEHSLNVYQLDPEVLKDIPGYSDLLFIPFKDLTSGKETYGGGRYIDIRTPTGSEVILDFNLAYNPSCAYGSDRYNCPIPPKENFLQTKIFAGEKSYVSPLSGSEH